MRTISHTGKQRHTRRNSQLRNADDQADLRRLHRSEIRGMEKHTAGKLDHPDPTVRLHDGQERDGFGADNRRNGHPAQGVGQRLLHRIERQRLYASGKPHPRIGPRGAGLRRKENAETVHQILRTNSSTSRFSDSLPLRRWHLRLHRVPLRLRHRHRQRKPHKKRHRQKASDV